MKKVHNKYPCTNSYSKHLLNFGTIGFKAVSSSRLTEPQINALTKALFQKLKIVCRNNKSYKTWNLLFLNSVLTKLSAESRMGKGKGAIWTKMVFVRAGTVIFELSNIKKYQVVEVFNFIKKLSPLKLILIEKI